MLQRLFRLHITQTWSGVALAEEQHAFAEVAMPASAADQCKDGAVLTVTVEAPWNGDPPPDAPPGHCEGLWNHEVVELFLIASDGNLATSAVRYLEIEFGPHAHYLVIELVGIRQRQRTLVPSSCESRRLGDRWRAVMRMPIHELPASSPGELSANAFAIRGVGHERLYTACRPTGGDHPDFHPLQAAMPLDNLEIDRSSNL